MPRRLDVVAYTSNPPTAMPLLEGIASFGMTDGGWKLTVFDASDPNLARKLKQSPSEGAIVMIQNALQARQLARVHKPMVNVVTEWKTPLPVVLSDDVAAGRIAAHHLLDRGLRSLIYVGISGEASHERWKGFRAGAVSAGAQVAYGGPRYAGFVGSATTLREETSNIEPESWSWQHLLSGGVLTWFTKRLPSPCGVLAFNDIIAMQIIDACERTGRSVPEDVAVVGVDNDRLRCCYGAVTLSSVDLGLAELGREAARVLVERIEGREVPKLTKIAPVGVVVRASTDVLAVAEPEIRSALRFIRENACKQITSRDVVEHVALSRSTLDRRFETLIGRSMGAEIRRVRLEEARRLVRGTDLALDQVSRLAGFSSQQNLCRAYRSAFGATPGTDRKLSPRSPANGNG